MKSLWIGGAFVALALSASAQIDAPATPANPAQGAPAQETPPVVTVQPPTPGEAVPFAGPTPSIVNTSSILQLESAGHDALADGHAELAMNYFKTALSKPGLDPATKDQLNLNLTMAYLALGRLADAAAALNAVQQTYLPAFILRKALLAVRNQDWANAGTLVAQLDAAQLSKDDLPWYYALEAMLAEQGNDLAAATKDWTQARDAATTDYQKSQFYISLWRAQILLGKQVTPAEAQELLSNAQQSNTDLNLASQYILPYIVIEDKLGDRAKALATAQEWFNKPGLNLVQRDTLRLEYVIIDSEDPAHSTANFDQQALQNILTDRLGTGASARDAEALVQLQKYALSLLENAKMGGAAPLAGDVADFQQFVNGLVDDPRGHPLMKQLRLLQAQIALSLKQYPEAMKDAQAVVDMPPEQGRDRVREDALRLLAYVAWASDPPKYSDAAHYLSTLLDALPKDDPERKTLTVLMSDMYFLYGDYSDARIGYTSLLSDANPPTPPGAGVLLMRAIECDLNSGPGGLDEALALLDSTRQRVDIDDSTTNYRWQAEYNVLTALRDTGTAGEQDAAKRLSELLDPSSPGASLLPAKLELRLRWLAASIAVQIGDPTAADKASVLQQEILALPPGIKGISPSDRSELGASALLLRMQAAANVHDSKDEQQFYNELLKNYSDKDENSGQSEVISAMFAQASELAAQNKSADAQDLMGKLVKQFPNSANAPYASFLEAEYAAMRNSTDSYNDAIKLFNSFVNAYPGNSLVYKARLEEAGLLQSSIINDQKSAYDIYDNLLRNPPPGASDAMQAKAEMGRVYCQIVLADHDQAKCDQAMGELERLYSLQSLPVEDRVEAGFQLGRMKEIGPTPDPDGAASTYFLVYDTFLNDAYRDELATNIDMRHWLTECMFYLASIYEHEGKSLEARAVYQKIVDYNLENVGYAKSKLESSSATPPAPPPPTPPAPLPPTTPPAPATQQPATAPTGNSSTPPASTASAPADTGAATTPPASTTAPISPTPAAAAASSSGTAAITPAN